MSTIELPSWDSELSGAARLERTIAQTEAWIASDTLRKLASHWGGIPPAESGANELFSWYDTFSAENWDFRQGRERHEASTPQFAPNERAAIEVAATDLGMVESTPPKYGDYDFTLVLGGLIRACLTRPRYARELVDRGTGIGALVALGGRRQLTGNEIELAENLGLEVADEFEAMIEGVRSAFTQQAPRVEASTDAAPENHDWAIAVFPDSQLQVIAAPSRDPQNRRANTPDTFAWWAQRTPGVERSRVLPITNPIYVPYQGASAIEHLGFPFGVSVETVGISGSAADLGLDTQVFQPHNYLQEIRSAIRGYKALHERLLA